MPAMALKEAMTAPPNLRQSKGSARCATCEHFQKGACGRYGGYSVKPGQVCNSFSPRKA